MMKGWKKALFSLSLVASLPATAWGTAANGYYAKDTGPNFTHYDAMARFAAATVDGQISVGEWDMTLAQEIYKYDRDDNRIRIAFQYDSINLYILVEVDDDKLWADSGGNLWETWDDDGVEIYLDGDNSRTPLLLSSDRLIAFNINSSRYRFDAGNNIGSTQYYNEISMIQKAVGITGTLNTPGDVDSGYVVELAVPWPHVGVIPSAHTFISANVLVLEDDNGGPLNVFDNTAAWDEPFEVDRFFKWFGDGLRGPEGYARVYLLPGNDATPPGGITNLATTRLQPRSAVLTFTAPGNDIVTGQASRYLARYSVGEPITSAEAWDAANELINVFIPRVAGRPEILRLPELSPATTYHVAVRAVDYAGNVGPLSNAVSFTTPVAADNYGKGRIYPSPAGRFFIYEDGSPFLPVPEPAGITWVGIRDLYTRPLWENSLSQLINWSDASISSEVGNAERFIQSLAGNGINLIRIFIEDLAFADPDLNPMIPNGVSYLEYPAATDISNYVTETLAFLGDFLTLCERYDIQVTFTPWDNYFYRDYWSSNPYNSANGGPISSFEEFVSDPTARNAQKHRLQMLNSVVNGHPNFFGWEIMNEWDNDSFASRNEGWEAVRMEWIRDLVSFLRSIDSEHMIFTSSVHWQPQFELKDFLLQSDLFDFVGVHNYTKAVKDPTASGDSDVTIRPAMDSGRFIRYMIGNTVDKRPVLDLEFGPISLDVYDSRFSQVMDEETFHNISWAELGAGAAGMPLRWPSRVLEFRGPQLTDTMWAYQANMARFFANTQVDLPRLASVPWERHIRITGADTVIPFANSDGSQGLVWLLQDTRHAGNAVNNATLTVGGLAQDIVYLVETWDTRAVSGDFQRFEVASVNASFSLNLPAFERDLMVTFVPLTKAVIRLAEPRPTLRPSLSQAVAYKTGDRVVISLPVAVSEKNQYVALGLPDNSLFLLTSLNQLTLFDGINLLPWQGDTTAIDLVIDAGLPRGIFQVYLLETPVGITDPMAHPEVWELGVTELSVE